MPAKGYKPNFQFPLYNLNRECKDASKLHYYSLIEPYIKTFLVNPIFYRYDIFLGSVLQFALFLSFIKKKLFIKKLHFFKTEVFNAA